MSKPQKQTIDLGQWRGSGGSVVRATVTIDPARFGDLVNRAAARHDKETRIGNGAIVVRVTPEEPS